MQIDLYCQCPRCLTEAKLVRSSKIEELVAAQRALLVERLPELTPLFPKIEANLPDMTEADFEAVIVNFAALVACRMHIDFGCTRQGMHVLIENLYLAEEERVARRKAMVQA